MTNPETVLTAQLASWRKEVARLQDMIAAAEPSAQDEIQDAFKEWFGESTMQETPGNLAFGYWAQEAFKAGAQWQASRAPVVQAAPECAATNATVNGGDVHHNQVSVSMDNQPCSELWTLGKRCYIAPSAPQPVAQAAPDDLRKLIMSLRYIPSLVANRNYMDGFDDAKCLAAGLVAPQAAVDRIADIKREIAEHLAEDAAPQAVAAPERDAVPDILFDGYAVLQALTPHAKTFTTAENVSAVLDAVVRLIRHAPQPIAAPADNVEVQERHKSAGYAGTSQQPVPSDAAVQDCFDGGKCGAGGYCENCHLQQPVPRIDSDEFHKCVMEMRNASGKFPQDKYRALVAYIENWAAQLVQQPATLSDEQIEAAYEQATSYALKDEDRHGAIAFARAILAAGSAA